MQASSGDDFIKGLKQFNCDVTFTDMEICDSGWDWRTIPPRKNPVEGANAQQQDLSKSFARHPGSAKGPGIDFPFSCLLRISQDSEITGHALGNSRLNRIA
jgi:hypothetical protein